MKISIITVTYNSGATLQRCIDSVFYQSYKNKEHIIIDGGSKDETIDIILKNLDKIDKWISEKDDGIFDAINKGIKLATGDVIGLLHSDDFYPNNNVLDKIAKTFNEKSKFFYSSFHEKNYFYDYPDCVYSDLVYINKNGDSYNGENIFKLKNDIKIIRYWKTHKEKFSNNLDLKKLIKLGWMPPHPTLFVRKELFEKYGFYRTDLKIASDYEMILRLFYNSNLKIKYIPEVLYYMSIGGSSNKSIKNMIKKSSEDYYSIKLYKIPFPIFVLILKNISKLKQFIFKSNIQNLWII
jgi:glycosyltransferase